MRYVAGDRLGILPQSNPELVQKTLRALGAEGNEPIRLTSAWRTALNPDAGKVYGLAPARPDALGRRDGRRRARTAATR